MIFGYMRISTQKEKQTTDRQRITLDQYAAANNFNFDEILEERISGNVQAERRPVYNELKARIRKGDILIITDIDRLGRNADDVIMEFKKLKADGIRVIALDTPYLNEWEKIQDSSMYNMIADIFITLKAHIAQQEREKTVARINQGLQVAKAKGKVLGRPKAELPSNFIKEYDKFKKGEYGNVSASGFAKMLGIGRSTLYKYIKLYEDKERGDS
ncbi:recombinase family protein [Clostridium chromiireducens]|uniref:Putative DNA-invertase from lambdoid prophage Rac n=1 Tax=Clostridium chromiireducens TaxID=225345 RepID=A0A1V4J0B9_9CLOT|nr:recombinase family protein [Clostridium chromiireducens]OPJ65748.1 putative DNA-invertase from lambdoid prophage Rac [Clostridium chromiireducens]